MVNFCYGHMVTSGVVMQPLQVSHAATGRSREGFDPSCSSKYVVYHPLSNICSSCYFVQVSSHLMVQNLNIITNLQLYTTQTSSLGSLWCAGTAYILAETYSPSVCSWGLCGLTRAERSYKKECIALFKIAWYPCQILTAHTQLRI